MIGQHQASDKLAYRINEAVLAIGLGRSTIYDLIKAGRLRTIKASGRRLILKSDLEAYLKSCREDDADTSGAAA